LIINLSENSIENLKLQLETQVNLYKKAIAENKTFREARRHYLKAKKLEQEVERRTKEKVN
jgi:hypothetical protein